jgi:hypothetical protein
VIHSNIPYPTQQQQTAHMETVLDVRDLPDERVEYLKNLITLWRKQNQDHPKEKSEKAVKEEDRDIVFTAHPSKVIGRLTRQEIYDYL